jgi:hypothetical protein
MKKISARSRKIKKQVFLDFAALCLDISDSSENPTNEPNLFFYCLDFADFYLDFSDFRLDFSFAHIFRANNRKAVLFFLVSVSVEIN